ncbi:MAG: hypothetical protein IKR09_03775 [Alphaproteobacteria bacterium]|nr:hypothetical protein [Alphaproteobacteria bacterium]
MESANKYLEQYVSAHNKMFSKPARNGNAYTPLPDWAKDIDDVCFVEVQRKINNDWTVCYKGKIYQIPPMSKRIPAVNGRVENIILGIYNSRIFTPENAIKKSQEMFKLINAGVNPNEKKHILSKDITIETLLEKYLGKNEKTNGQKNKETTLRDKTYLLKKHLKSLFKRKVSSISQDDLKKLHKDISETTPTAANRTIVWISAMFTWAQNNGLFSGKNPAEKFPKRNPEKNETAF